MSKSVATTGQLEESVADRMRHRLAGFARTLRDNGFKVGLAETRDALVVFADPAAARPTFLKSALRSLFCTTHSDWQRFDDVFDAYWLSHGRRQTPTLSGTMSQPRSPLRTLPDGPPSQSRLPDHVERTSEGDIRSSDGRAQREGASRFENLASVDMRRIVDPARRHTGGPRLAPPQDQAAAPGRTARRIRIHEFVYGLFRWLPSWRG